MHFALVIVGALLGLILKGLAGGDWALWFPALVGGFVGYAIAEFRGLRARNETLERELAALKERLAAAQQRKQNELIPTAGGVPRASGVASSATGAASLEPSRSAISASGWSGTPARNETVSGGPESIGAPGKQAATDSESVPNGIDGARGFEVPSPGTVESPILRAAKDYFTGGNTLVRIGVLILFFGVAFLLRYVAEHSHVPIQFRLSGVAIGGGILLVLGWRLRARRRGYALALQGGGVGILYLTTFAALRLYSILSPPAAFFILLFLAAFSAVLAVLQDSQAFAVLAVTGGFLAPILASTGEGSHIVLFSYFAVLNASILGIAWYKTWRPLNLVGFAFTFLISAAWGALHYQSELFASTEPFLALFFVFYLSIAILFSLKQPPKLRGYVDGTLIFGTPMAAFGYQSAMLHDRPVALAVSAVVMGAVYFLLAWFLHRRKLGFLGLLVEAFVALGVVFFTVAIPLALSGPATGVTWALEGAGLVWIGVRQNRALPRVFGVLLQVAVALIQVINADSFFGGAGLPLGLYLARATTAVAAVSSAVLMERYSERLRSFERVVGAALFLLGLVEWLFCGLVEIYRYIPAGYDTSVALVFVAATALISSELWRRTALQLARLAALCLLPALVLFAFWSIIPEVRRPFDFGGWLVWPLAFAAFYFTCRRHEGPPNERLAKFLHVTSAWLLVWLLTCQFALMVESGVARGGSWPAVGWMLVPAVALFCVPRLAQRVSWPFRAHREAYVALAGTGIALYLAMWSLGTNLGLPGDPYPFPYVPLLNVLDLAQVLVLAVLVRFCLVLKSGQFSSYARPGDVRVAAGVASLSFVWANAALVRTLQHWAGVPFDLDAVIRSTLVQTSLSIFWTILALATMLVATRRTARAVWIVGASLLAVTILKLFVIDLSRVGTVERIVSFVGVGLLTLVIGYFSPLPPSATSHRTSVS
jgi:uncharacterized membrane protein